MRVALSLFWGGANLAQLNRVYSTGHIDLFDRDCFHDIPAFIMTTAGALETIFNVLWLPLYAIAYVIFYFDLRVRNQGYDLSQRIDQIESETGLAF